jgi:hypothetical protein
MGKSGIILESKVAWRSWLARTVHIGEVSGSSPDATTTIFRRNCMERVRIKVNLLESSGDGDKAQFDSFVIGCINQADKINPNLTSTKSRLIESVVPDQDKDDEFLVNLVKNVSIEEIVELIEGIEAFKKSKIIIENI